MRFVLALALMLAAAPSAFAQAAAAARGAVAPPTLAEVRADMNIPSVSLDLRGQRDSVGFASTAAQMAKVWELSAAPPAPDSLGPRAAARRGRRHLPARRLPLRRARVPAVLPLVTARTVVLVGVFHRYRRFGEHDRLVFDRYRAWRTPDGPVPVSGLREDTPRPPAARGLRAERGDARLRALARGARLLAPARPPRPRDRAHHRPGRAARAPRRRWPATWPGRSAATMKARD